MLRLYNTALWPLRVAVDLWSYRPLATAAKRVEWAERRARKLAAPRPGGVWIHGASVGEARITRDLAARLRAARPALPLAVSAVTVTGRAQLPAPPAVDAAFYSPLDFPGWPARVLRALAPALLVLVETELWPNLVREASACGVRVVLVNGRLSSRRMAAYRRWSALYRPVLAALERCGVQTEEDAGRFAELGARPAALVVTGNVKYDLSPPEADVAALATRLGLGAGRPVFVAGSTAKGEDEPVLDAFAQARSRFADLLLVLAPRHPERVARVEQLVVGRGLQTRRLSQAQGAGAAPDVVVVDTVGELAALYRLATVAFVGGSLAPVGGHNVLEPAAVGVPVLFGPYTANVREPADALLRAGAAERVADATQLAAALVALLGDGERRAAMGLRAARLVRESRGALARSAEIVLGALER